MFGKRGPAVEETHASLRDHIFNRDSGALEASLASLRWASTAVNHRSSDMTPLLLLAATQDDAPSVSLLLRARASINIADSSGATAAFVAARSNAAAALEVLIRSGCDVNQPRASGATPLYVAAQNDSRAALAMLIAGGAAVDAPKEGGFTPLLIAAMRGHAPCVSALLQAGADPDRAYDVADRWSALMVAAHLDQRDVLEALCRAGASVLLRDAGGRTAREVAEAAGHESAAALLQGREEEEALEAEAASQEGLLQEVRQLGPVQASLQLESDAIAALQPQCARLLDEEETFVGAARLQQQCLLATQTLLPARRASLERRRLEAEITALEVRAGEAERAYRAAVAAVRDSPDDAAALPARDGAAATYATVLATLRLKVEARRTGILRAAAAKAELEAALPALGGLPSYQEAAAGVASAAVERGIDPAAAAGLAENLHRKGKEMKLGWQNAATQVNAVYEAGSAPAGEPAPSMPEALGEALPVLRAMLGQVGEANRETQEAMATLRRALERELELLAAVKGPLAVATARCGAALSAGVSEALSGDAEAELAMAQQHASVVDQEERLAAGAKVLAEANAAMQRLASLSEQKLCLEDEIDGLRRGDSTEAVEARRAAAVAQMDALAAEAALARATLSDPALRQGLQAHYPEAACKAEFFFGLWPEEARAEEARAEEGAPPCPADEEDSTGAAAPQESEAPSMPPPSTPPPSMPPPSMPPPSTPPPSMPPPSTPPPSIPPPSASPPPMEGAFPPDAAPTAVHATVTGGE